MLGKTVELRQSPFGGGTLTCTGVISPFPTDGVDEVWGLARNDERMVDQQLGFLVLDGMTALRVVSATLGLPAPRLSRPLGTSERGIVTAALAAAFRVLWPEVKVLLGRTDWDGRGRVSLLVAAKFQSNQEQLRLDLLPDWLPPPDSTAWLLETTRRGLEITLAVNLAQTTLTALEWARARSGDVVVFDGQAAQDVQSDWSARLVCGQYAAQVSLTVQGVGKLLTDFRPTGARRDLTINSSDIAAAAGGEKDDQKMSSELEATSLTMLASAPVEVVAEIARMVMRADEVMALRAGAVLPVGFLRPNLITLRIADRVWAHGELVDVDGQLGVRLTATPPPHDRQGDPSEADTLR